MTEDPDKILARYFEFDSADDCGVRLTVSVGSLLHMFGIPHSLRVEVDVDGRILAAYIGPEDARALASVLREWVAATSP